MTVINDSISNVAQAPSEVDLKELEDFNILASNDALMEPLQQVLQVPTQQKPHFVDYKTGALIPASTVQKVVTMLEEKGNQIRKSEAAYGKIIKQTRDHLAAKSAAEAILPGGRSRAFDHLTEIQALCNIIVIAPPVRKPPQKPGQSKEEYDRVLRHARYDIQNLVKDLILRINGGLEGLIFDVFTSIKVEEHMGVPASETCVRFPYYVASTVSTLIGQINMTTLGPFSYKAYFLDMGRTTQPSSHKHSKGYTPWNVAMAGVPIPHLSPEVAKTIPGKIKMESMVEKLKQHCNVGVTLPPEKIDEMLKKMNDNLNTKDFQIENTNTFKLASLLMHQDLNIRQKGMVTLARFILVDANLGLNVTEGKVWYYEVVQRFHMGVSPIFLSVDQGESLMCFDPPFVNHLFGESKDIKYDYVNPNPSEEDTAKGFTSGQRMVFAMKYKIIDKHLTVDGVGLIFLQMCTPSSRHTKSPYLSQVFRELMAHVGERNLANSTDTDILEKPCKCGNIVAVCGCCGQGYAQVYYQPIDNHVGADPWSQWNTTSQQSSTSSESNGNPVNQLSTAPQPRLALTSAKALEINPQSAPSGHSTMMVIPERRVIQ